MPIWLVVAIASLGASGLALALWSIRGDPSRGRARCPHCWYDMAAAAGLRCPECGRSAKSLAHLHRTRRCWRWIALASALLLTAAALGPGHALAVHGWHAVPSPILFLVVPWGNLDVNNATGQPSDFNVALAEAAQHPLPEWKQRLLASRLGAVVGSSADPIQRERAASHIGLAWSIGDNGLMDRCLPVLEKAIDDPNPGVATEAARTVARLCDDDPRYGALWMRLSASPNDELREIGTNMLARLVERGQKQYLPLLIKAAADPVVNIASAAAIGLSWSGDPSVLPTLIAMIDHQEDFLRSVAINRLGRMEATASPAVPALQHVMQSSRPGRANAAGALGNIGPAARAAIPDLLNVLRDGDTRLRFAAAIALSKLVPGDLEVVTALRAEADNLQPRVMLESLYRARWIPGAADRGVVEAAMKPGGVEERIWGQMLLAQAEGKLDEMVDRLVALLASQNVLEVETAAKALDSMGLAAARALPALEKLCPPIPRRGMYQDEATKYSAAKQAIRHIKEGAP